MDILFVLLGSASVLAGILGKRFTVGLRGRMPTSPWLGRTWLIGFGLIIAGKGIFPMLAAHHPVPEITSFHKIAEEAGAVFLAAFEVLFGLGMAIFGVLLLARERSTLYRIWIYIAVAASVGGSIFPYDGISTIFAALRVLRA
jgi:hypothetical protein